MKQVTLYQWDGRMQAPWYHEGAINQTMGYVLVTGSGKLVVIDGGYRDDAEALLDFLRELGGEKPVVDAWIFTHMHDDHVSAFGKIMSEHADELTVKSVWYHFPTEEEIACYDNGTASITYGVFFAGYENFKDAVHIAEVGDKLTVDDVTFEVLFVPVNRYADSHNLNNSSVVYRMEACGQSVLFLGDLAESASADFLFEAPAGKIKADIVQMAHHGQYGVTRAVYEAVSPKCCLWCAPDWLWNNDAGKGYNTHGFQTVIVRNWMKELGVKHHLVQKNGLEKLVLPADFDDMSWGQEEDPR